MYMYNNSNASKFLPSYGFLSNCKDYAFITVRLSSNNVPYGHSVDTVASHFEEEEPFESLEEIEAQTIGNLLPSDDDLFRGITDKLDNINQSNSKDDMEELDFFNSVGGLDLGDDRPATQNDIEFPGAFSNGQPGLSNGSKAGQHPHGEHPSRTLFVRNLDSNVEDSELRALFEVRVLHHLLPMFVVHVCYLHELSVSHELVPNVIIFFLRLCSNMEISILFIHLASIVVLL